MDVNIKNKWQIRLAVLAIFVIGFIAGGLAIDLYRKPHWGWGPPPDRRFGRFEQTIERLDLTPEQKTQVTAIFDDARAQLDNVRKESEPKFREVRKQTDERLKAVLTPEQWEQFQQMKSEFRGRPHGRGRREGRP
jgi:Spy/CpxP family protein refolding chaperone